MNIAYKHLVQKLSLCGPTCLQMVLFRRGIWIEQEQIAKEIGVKVPESASKTYHTQLPIGQNLDELGISLIDFKSQKIHDFFAKHQIPLRATVYFTGEISDPADFITKHLQAGHDIMVNFWMGYFKDDQKGHYGLISGLNGDTVTICDPWLENKSFWETDLQVLIKTMTKEFDGEERGFVVFE